MRSELNPACSMQWPAFRGAGVQKLCWTLHETTTGAGSNRASGACVPKPNTSYAYLRAYTEPRTRERSDNAWGQFSSRCSSIHYFISDETPSSELRHLVSTIAFRPWHREHSTRQRLDSYLQQTAAPSALGCQQVGRYGRRAALQEDRHPCTRSA